LFKQKEMAMKSNVKRKRTIDWDMAAHVATHPDTQPAEKDMEVPMTNSVLLQRLEGLILLLVALALYTQLGQSWWLFLILLLAPDLFMLGYLAGPKVGAMIYNLGHLLLWPVLLIGIGFLVANSLLTGLGAIWLAHLGLDRVLGYGFKLPTGFKNTHLGRIGR
jgi:lysylphosphatidylglycerol synthetase-like protein (DUF2156 family)